MGHQFGDFGKILAEKLNLSVERELHPMNMQILKLFSKWNLRGISW